MRERWVESLIENARTHWTKERTWNLTRGKQLPVLPGEAPVLLRALGLLRKDASLPPNMVPKFGQINHMILVLEPALRELRARFERLHVLDAGCGRSYLTAALAWCFRHVFQHPVHIVGIDRNPHLIEECRRRAALAELEDVLTYQVGAIDAVDVPTLLAGEPLHTVIALHACDTATDQAIALGVQQRAELIATAPCCHAELSQRWKRRAKSPDAHPFAPIWRTPHLCRTQGADVTDALRMLLLRAAGYDARALEFVPSEHTPRNTLIRAIRRERPSQQAWEEYIALRDATGGEPIALEGMLFGDAGALR